MLKSVKKSGSRLPDYTPSLNGEKRQPEDVRNFIPRSQLERQWEDYLSLGCSSQSLKTIRGKRDLLRLILRFLDYKGYDRFDRASIAAFLSHVKNGHLEPKGRYGLGPTHPRYYDETRDRTGQLYYNYIRAFCDYLVADEWLDESPTERISRPSATEPDVQPYTDDEVLALIEAAQETDYALRNVAIVTLMYDAGLRADEVCGLKNKDIDLGGHYCRVRGKGNKPRIARFGDVSAQAILKYRRSRRAQKNAKGKRERDEDLDPNAPVFCRGRCGGEKPLQVRGLQMMYRRLGEKASITIGGKGTHRMRHSYATNELENGVNQKRVQAQMGHKTPHMVLRYQHAVDADVLRREKPNSPADRLLGKGRG